jgi:hypothetical protein
VGVVGVLFKLDGTNLGAEDTTAPYGMSWNTTSISNGTHVLAAVARDKAGNVSSSAPVTVTVKNLSPPPPPPPPPPPSPAPSGNGVWISQSEVAALPMSGAGWNNVKSAADSSCGTPDLANQDDSANVCVMAKALVFARTGQASYRDGVISALKAVINSGTYNGRALALGRELAAYVIAADLIDLKNYDAGLDGSFRNKIKELRTTSTSSGPSSLIDCHESRPNNWGLHCGASRAAVAAYLGDTAELARTAQVFQGWLGDRSSYAGFDFGDLSWQCSTSAPVGINPAGCTISGHNVDGVLPDDQRRCGTFGWPPCKTNYSWEAMQGAVAQAVILGRAGYDVWNWQDKALLRAARWLFTTTFSDGSNDPPASDDEWQPFVLNHYYGSGFPASSPASPGKNVGWTDWTHAQ